jgi:hypothetical protein
VQYVGAGEQPDEPPFGYTVGLFGLGHPELVLVGLGPKTAHSVLHRLAGVVSDGRDLVAGELLAWPEWADIRLVVEVLPNPGEVVLVANRFYERPAEYSVPAFQLTWAFPDHCFPWEGDGPDDPAAQPRPGTWRA